MTLPSPSTSSEHPLDPEVMRSHGLQQQPFTEIHDEEFLYSDPALEAPVHATLAKLQSDQALVVITGETGIGKSTQVLRLLSVGEEQHLFCAFKASTNAEFASIEQTLRESWTTAAGSAGAQPGVGLAELLCLVCHGKHRPVIVIDDADSLERSVLSELLTLREQVRQQCGMTPGMVLTGAPGLVEQLIRSTSAEAPLDPYSVITLPALTPEQVEAYLYQRLQAAGAKNPGVFSGEIAESLHIASQGHPAALNTVANQRLISLAPIAASFPWSKSAKQPAQGQSTRRRIPVGFWRWSVPALGGILAFVSILHLTGFLDIDPSATPTADPPPLVSRPTPSPEPRALQPERWAGQDLALDSPLAEIPETFDTTPAEHTAELSVPAHEGLREADAEELPTQLVEEPEITIEAIATAPEPTTTEPEPSIAETSPRPAPAEDAAAATPQRPAPRATERPAPPPAAPTLRTAPPPAAVADTSTTAPPPAAAPRIPQPPPIIPQRTQLPASAPTAAAAPPAASPAYSNGSTTRSPAALHGSSWIQDQPGGHFTIQIAAGTDEASLRAHARRLNLGTDAAIFVSQRDGQTWFHLVVGSYSSTNQARQAINQLPAEARRNDPWVRPFSAIQGIMRSS